MKITPEKILFFDLDGTLVDTDYANWYAYTEAANQIDLGGYNHIVEKAYYERVYNAGIFDSLPNPNGWLNKISSDIKKYDDGIKFNFEKRLVGSFFEKFILEEDYKEIIERKQHIYSKNLHLTKKIEENISILKRFSKTNKIILVSNCKKARGLETLKYHQLDGYFHKMFFAEDKTLSENKYENAIKHLNISPNDIIAFEDSREEIEKAKDIGIKYINICVDRSIKDIFKKAFSQSNSNALIYQNLKTKLRIEIDNDVLEAILKNKDENLLLEIDPYKFLSDNENRLNFDNPIEGHKVKIKIEGLKEFSIETNRFLKQKIKGFYRRDYFSGGNWDKEGKIEFALWSLKNDTGCKNHHKEYLATAYKIIKNILSKDLFELKYNKKIAIPLVICVVPRAKEGFLYNEDQLLFRKIVSDVVDKLNNDDLFSDTDLINGTKYLVRHTSTQTTHLKDEGIPPYIGITKDTCYISDNVIGKDILLIDDIYTKSINIIEDAIQALLDKGARSVHFYAIGKTYSYK